MIYGEMPEWSAPEAHPPWAENGTVSKTVVALKSDPGFAPAFAGRPAYAGRIPFTKYMFYVYILLSLKDKKFYIGFSSDLRRRMIEHDAGKVVSTKNRRPLRLIGYEAYKTKSEAQRREKFLKTSDGKKDIKKRFIESLE